MPIVGISIMSDDEFNAEQTYSTVQKEDGIDASSESGYLSSNLAGCSFPVSGTEHISSMNFGSCAAFVAEPDISDALLMLQASSNLTGKRVSPWSLRKTQIHSAMMKHSATICLSIDFVDFDQREHQNIEEYILSTGFVPFSSVHIPDFAYAKHGTDGRARSRCEPRMTRLRARQTQQTNGRHRIKRNITVLECLPYDQLRCISHILTTREGATLIERYERFVFREQKCDGAPLFTSSHNQYIFAVVPNEIWSIGRIASRSERFLSLLGLTLALWRLRTWIHIYEDRTPVSRITFCLAEAWSSVIGCSDAELGIDSLFTRPAVERLLMDLEDRLGNSCYKLKFNWRPPAYLY